jgi:hypothetical protein
MELQQPDAGCARGAHRCSPGRVDEQADRRHERRQAARQLRGAVDVDVRGLFA